MYIEKMTDEQIKKMIKVMLLEEARTESYYFENIKAITDESIFDYKIMEYKKNSYIVAKINNGDIFIFDDCNYFRLKKQDVQPCMLPISLQKNTNVYLNFMRVTFEDYYLYEDSYNKDIDNIVNIVNFCDVVTYKPKHSNRTTRDYSY